MSDKLYRIRKLVWAHDGDQIRADCANSIEYVIRASYSHYIWRQWGGFENWREADSVAVAKLAAEAHWVSRIESCLEVAE